MFKKMLFLTLLLTAFASIVKGQVTTAGLVGKVTADGEAIIGATILAVHEPSGTTYGATTNVDGRFALPGMRTGGPYKVTVSYIGYQSSIYKGINLVLGENYNLSVKLKESTELLEEVTVIGSKEGAYNSQRNGAAESFSNAKITGIPMVNRSIYDVTKFIPQAANSGDGMSFAGSNNRYNSFSIDGTVNNDVFGLTSSGTNGGQTGSNPISLEAIDEIQVAIAPFDVRQNGFTGAGINAITKSGNNKFRGSLYTYFNNQDLIGSTPGKDVEKREKYDKQSSKTYGMTLSGPILKNKLFFFINAEKTKDKSPTNYGVANGSSITKDEADQVINKLKDLANGYDGGGYGAQDINSESTKFLARIDWNINEGNKLMFRYNYLKAERLNFSNSLNSLRLNDNGYIMNDKTHSFVAELNSRFSNKLSNDLRLGYTRVRDFRQPSGQPLPYVKINLDKTRSIQLGTERYSAANSLDQDIYTLTDNLNLYLGNHTLTFGTHNELYKMKNLFIRENFGSYTYNSLSDFLSVGTNNEVLPVEYNYSFSREEITGSKSWAPSFSTAQLGFYVQDEWMMTDNFRLSYGLRADVPIFLDKPGANDKFNASSIAKEYSVATNQMPKTRILWSPRLGFRWNADENKQTLLRGGIGIFTSRVPFVWISNSFSNTGVEYSRTRLRGDALVKAMEERNGHFYSADPAKQYTPAKSMTSEIDVVDKNFKYPQVFRANLAVEQMLPFGIKGTLEGLYSKTLNNILSKNLVFEESGKYLNNGADKRPLYRVATNPSSGEEYTKDYTGVVYLTNTNKGYTYNITAKLEKNFNFGLNAMAAYTYSRSKSVNDGTSSQALSNWRYNSTWAGSNNPEVSYSNFNVPHRIIASLSYRKEYAGHFATTLSLFYNGQSGSNYTLSYNNSDINRDTYRGNDLMYIPTDGELANMKFSGTDAEQEEQRAAFGEWINLHKELRDKKGHYAERNGFHLPFVHQFDLHLSQDFFMAISGHQHTLQLNFDILNVGNLLNRSWGVYKSVQATTPSVENVDANGVPTFSYEASNSKKPLYYDNVGTSSRWKAQIGVKYIF